MQVISVIAGLAIVALIIYLGNLINSTETIQDRLRYQQPQILPAEARPDGTIVNYTYVPVYSHIYAMGGEPFLLEATLSIRNPDPLHAMEISAIDLYDTSGKQVRSYLDSPVSLAPMATADYLLERTDSKGGSGANFVVQWSSPRNGARALMESVMIGSQDDLYISFSSRGIRLPYPMTEQ
ncbi:DUF3124 domain-containing protein [Halieaceae bacterium IMCC14734]|uniref:DUF3124 domain-containing protein n=2 Tax=Candidatus Litorirhabdus singularis TaxID=2518993 RepID=A0ABT3TMA3_9GAMM|nr:DUF3124 domain-containing protein [Candidatus Litorirhabdus singularis]